MPTAAFATLGCKVNQYETNRIRASFEQRGFTITDFNEPADVYVVNSCSVTQTAERKSRQMIRRLARQNPNAVVVVTGCFGEMSRIRGEEVESASLVVPNTDKLNALEHLLAAHPQFIHELHALTPSIQSITGNRRTRATIKIQDGCDIFCSFCSIPFTRHTMASRPAAEILREVEEMAGQGYREFVVTGVLVGSYGPETGSGGADLPDVLRAMARIDGVERIRLSSIEPTQVTEKLLNAYREEPKLCAHLHIPLQSGDTSILKRMNRPYTRDDYLRICARAQELLPGLAVTTDILVGFPGEDREAFENSLDMVRRVAYARAHIFRFSPRPGTPAASYPDPVEEGEKEARSSEMASVCRETQRRFISRYLGRALPVLVEGKERADGMLSGYTDNYIRVLFPGEPSLIGTIVPVRLCETTTDGAIGEKPVSFQPEADAQPIVTVSGISAT